MVTIEDSRGMDLSTLSDLPGLENTNYKTGELTPYGIVFCLLTIIHAVIAAAIYKNIALLHVEIYCGIMTVIMCWWLYKWITCPHEYKTTPEGLVIKSGFLKKRYSWDEFTNASRIRNKDESDKITLFTIREPIIIRYRSLDNKTSYYTIAASIWQHLRKRHKSEQIPLTLQEQSFWTPIKMPAKTEYTYPLGHLVNATILLGSIMITFFGVTFFRIGNMTPNLLILPLLTCMICAGIFTPFIWPVCVVNVNNRGIWGYKGIFKVSMTWNEATNISVGWRDIQILADNPSRCFYIPSKAYAMLFASRHEGPNPLHTAKYRSLLAEDYQLRSFILGSIRLNNPNLAAIHPDMIETP